MPPATLFLACLHLSTLHATRPTIDGSTPPLNEGLSTLPNQSSDSETSGQAVSGCFSPKKLVQLAETFPHSTAPQSSILSFERQAFPAAVKAFVSRLAFHQISCPLSWKRKGVIGSDPWAAVRPGQLFPQRWRPPGRAGIRETERTRSLIVLYCPVQISFSP